MVFEGGRCTCTAKRVREDLKVRKGGKDGSDNREGAWVLDADAVTRVGMTCRLRLTVCANMEIQAVSVCWKTVVLDKSARSYDERVLVIQYFQIIAMDLSIPRRLSEASIAM